MSVKTHEFGATFQQGIVSQVDAKNHRIRATIPALENLETAWLPFLTLNAGGNQFYCLPDQGELVALFLDARGEGGCVLGTLFNDKDTTPASSNDMWVKHFKNGTVISHNRSNGEVIVKTSGHVRVTAGQITATADLVTINAQVNINGDVSVSGTITAPTVIASGVSLHQHVHGGVTPGRSNTGTPH